MRDLDITNRDLFGNVTFQIKSSSVSGIENVIQKVTTMLLSQNKTTYFGSIIGSDALSAGKFNYTNDNSSDFKLVIADNLINILNAIQSDESKYNIPVEDRIKDIQIKDLVFEKKTLNVFLSLIVSTNSATKVIQLPVKK
jgi:hypothetical protein